MTSQIEFAVQMTCESCVEDIKNSLRYIHGIKNVDIQLATGTVLVDSTLATDKILKILKGTGRKAVVKGSAGLTAGVAIIEYGDVNIQGVIRFMQIDNNVCIIDGTVDGLNFLPHSICVYECGDISQACKSIGSLYIPEKCQDKNVGILRTITPDENGRATFRFTNNTIDLCDIIGRSIVVTESNRKLACGIIARSAGLFQNPKTICACDGISLWDETKEPKSLL